MFFSFLRIFPVILDPPFQSVSAYDGKTVIVSATLSDIKKAEKGKGDMDSKKLVRVPSKVRSIYPILTYIAFASCRTCI